MSPSYSLPPINRSKLLIILLVFSLLSMAWIMVVALSLSLFLQIECGKYCIQIPFRRSSRAVRTSSFKIAFLELIKLIIVSLHRYLIQVLVAIPLYNLEFSDSDDSSLGIHIASRLPVKSKTVKRLTFTPPVGDPLVKENKEKDKLGTKPNKIKIKREAWKSPAMSKSSHN
nr:hypothetical protein [Tanacetum cinerariifolium]